MVSVLKCEFISANLSHWEKYCGWEGRLTKELTFSTCGVAQIIVEAETVEAKQIWTANPTNANGAAADAQREFNGTDLFGCSFVLSFFLGRFMAVQSRRSVIGQRRKAKSEERRGQKRREKCNADDRRRDRSQTRRRWRSTDQAGKLVLLSSSSQIQIDCKNKTLFIYWRE